MKYLKSSVLAHAKFSLENLEFLQFFATLEFYILEKELPSTQIS